MFAALLRQPAVYFNRLLWLVFPEVCAACEKQLLVGEKCICTHCRLHLPKTNFHLEKENEVAKLLWGKIPFRSASSFYYYRTGGTTQRLIHHFKYKGRKDIGTFIGELYGYELKQALSEVDLIVPVPLHKSKQRKRGYNQSEFFARGLSASLNIPVEINAIKRIKPTVSQTRKKGYDRYLNTEKSFSVIHPEKISGKHILLVDDVITTGSTITACAEALLTCPGTSISIATIAYA